MVNLFSLPGLSLGVAKIIDGNISITACSKQKSTKCPCCNKSSNQVHGSYVRVLRDLPASTYRVSINLTVRKFFCKNPQCERKIFTEQPGSEISAYSRMTKRTRKTLENILLEVSARKGSYLANLMSLPLSPSSALRMVGSLPIPAVEKVTVLGIDDWAYRKGLTYGTILVNIETGQVIDVLAGRDANSLKKWLVKHPEIKIVTRDRASSYSSAVSSILPNTIQVADRFHLLKNFSDCVYDVIRIEYRNIVKSLYLESSEQLKVQTPTSKQSNVELAKFPQKEKGERSDFLKIRFIKVKNMIQNGVTLRSIAKTLQMSRATVRSYAKMDVLPNKSISLRNNYDEYLVFIEKELSEGKTISAVFEIIKKAGFKGSRTAFYQQFKNHPKRTSPVIVLANVNQRIISPRKRHYPLKCVS
jgi:predicted transcriptional regulator